METKEYIVALNFGVDYSKFWTEIESGTSGSPFLPNRPVSIINSLDAMETLCHYALTDQEAELLSQDSRVAAVEIPADKDPSIIISGDTVYNGNYNKPGNVNTGDNINWGLVRHFNGGNPYGAGTTTTSKYMAVLDGTGVDVVIMDTGIEAGHPEFQDANGSSRVVQYNWTGSLDTSIGSPDFQDLNGHGTHCAGIAAGKTYGWAKNSKIYPIRIGLSGTPAPAISPGDAFNYIKQWHIRKNTPGDPIYSGRPTVVNMSWGTAAPDFLTAPVAEIRYRGNIINGPFGTIAPSPASGLISAGGPPVPRTQYDNSLEELTNAGVVVCKSAGNSGYKIDIPTTDLSSDYNNYYKTSAGSTIYYHRGGSPQNIATSTNKAAIIVGNLSDGITAPATERKAPSSNAGPGVDIFAAGTNIRSSVSNIHNTTLSSQTYFKDSNYKQINMTGTSMACPQVVGMCALYLQRNPTATPAEVKDWIVRNSTRDKFYKNPDSTINNDYTNAYSQFGGNTGIASMNIWGLSYVKDQSGTWKPVNRKYVKTEMGWKQVRYSWIKVQGGWARTNNFM